jgi:tetraacyldisaccharide 4'-kinase
VVITQRGEAGGARIHPRGPFTASARLRLGEAVNLVSGECRPLEAFRGVDVHAVAAVGHPEAFFAGLEAAGVEIRRHALPDHASLDPVALPFPAEVTVLMTEKDAVKCREYAQPGWWFVSLDVAIERTTAVELLALVLERTALTGAGVKLG